MRKKRSESTGDPELDAYFKADRAADNRFTPRRLKPKTLASIQPNVGVTTWYRNELYALVRQSHVDLLKELKAPTEVALAQDARIRLAGVRYVKPQIVHLAYDSDGQAVESEVVPERWEITCDAASPNARLDAALKRWGAKWNGKFDKAAQHIAKRFASKSYKATQAQFLAELKKAGFTVRFKVTKASLEAFRATVAENVGLIKSIQSQYLTRVQGDVWRAVTRGSDLYTLSQTLRKSYDVTTKRAALIARDQNAKAKATIENTRRMELGITQAIWQHSSAGKEPRPSHVAMNGKTFELAKGMFDSDEQEWILPGQLINCRCTSRAILPMLGQGDDREHAPHGAWDYASYTAALIRRVTEI
jgi:SPP1 gp7 family putative phage head morphogenesis protein